jgi:hypothetical protein
MQSILRAHGPELVRTPVIGSNSAVFKDGTLVSKDSGGFLIVSTAGLRIWGVCRQEVTMASDNQTVAKVCPIVVEHINLDLSMLGDQAVVAGDLFKWADISTVALGLQLVALSTASTAGQLAVQGKQSDFDGSVPLIGDTTQVVVRVGEWQDLAYAQV